jgi:hypothetical protein
MLFLSNQPSVHRVAARSRRRVYSVWIAQVLLLAGCASPTLDRNASASEDASKRRSDALACKGSYEPLTGLLSESMLLGLTMGGGPAVIESGNAARRKSFQQCMDARRGQPVS